MLIANEKSYLIFSLKKIPSVIEFGDYFGVKNDTYMFQTIERLYNYIFKGVLNLYDEYSKYYSNEYLEYGVFLENYYNLYEEEIKKIEDEKNSEKNVYFSDLSLKVDYGIQDFLSNEYEESRILSLIHNFFKEHDNED